MDGSTMIDFQEEAQVDAGATSGTTESEALRDQVKNLIHGEGMTQAQIARESGVKAPTLSQWLAGKYQGDNAEVDAKLETWLRVRGEREEQVASWPTAPDFVASPTAQKVFSTLQYAQGAGDMVEVYGAPGVGKTVTARRYRDRNPNVWIATMAPHAASVVHALEEVAEAVGLRDVNGGARGLARAIRRKIEGTRGLLIIDEAQHLSLGALEEIRSIHDATGTGLALMGSEVLHSRLTGGSRAVHLAQLFSRIGMRLFVRRPLVGDTTALLDAWGVKDKECRAFMSDIARKAGALRGFTKTLQLASARAAAAGVPMTIAHLQEAWSALGAQE